MQPDALIIAVIFGPPILLVLYAFVVEIIENIKDRNWLSFFSLAWLLIVTVMIIVLIVARIYR